MNEDLARELVSAQIHLESLSRIVANNPDSPLLVQLCERIDALMDELAWEIGTTNV